MKKNSDFIILDTNEELNNPVVDNRLWIAICNIDIPRRPLLDAVATSVYDYERTFLFLYKGSTRIWPIPDVYDVFGGIDGRWISYYRKQINGRPKHKPRPSTIERRRLLSLYFRLEHFEIWKHFKR